MTQALNKDNNVDPCSSNCSLNCFGNKHHCNFTHLCSLSNQSVHCCHSAQNCTVSYCQIISLPRVHDSSDLYNKVMRNDQEIELIKQRLLEINELIVVPEQPEPATGEEAESDAFRTAMMTNKVPPCAESHCLISQNSTGDQAADFEPDKSMNSVDNYVSFDGEDLYVPLENVLNENQHLNCKSLTTQ